MKRLRWLVYEGLFRLGCFFEAFGRWLEEVAGKIMELRRRLP